jgi:PAS domain S-box-containing protein
MRVPSTAKHWVQRLRFIGQRLLHPRRSHAPAPRERDAGQSQALLDRLSLMTQAAGLQCWEFDYKTLKIAWLDDGSEAAGATPGSVQQAGEARFAKILPEDFERVKLLCRAAWDRHEPTLSALYRSRDPDGTLHYIQSYHHFFYDEQGEPVRTLGADHDVTETYRRQAELEALSIRFGIATRSAHAGVWEWQERTDEIWWNDTMYGIYGYAADSFVPTLATLVAMIHPEDMERAQAAWARALSESGQVNVQFRITRPDGGLVHVESVATVITDAHTSYRRLVGITLDISQRVAAEQREQRLQKELREASHQSGMAEVATGVLHNVGNVLNSLGFTTSTVQIRLKASQFDRVERVAAMLDEHRNSLGDFFANDARAKRLPEYLSALGVQLKKDAGDLRREIEAISGHVQYLCEIVRAQQSFAHVGGAEEAVDVRELVDTALTLKAQELKGVQIERAIGEIPEILTDRFKLLQIMVNFIANACDAVAAIAPAARRIAIRAQLVDGQLEIAVDDCGMGIRAELLPRIWEFGFTTKAHGHGFGLHSSAVAAQQLGGRIAGSSPGPGLGASFRVTIPARMATDSLRAAVA